MSRYRVFLGAPPASSPSKSELEWHDIHITSDLSYVVGQTSQQAKSQPSLPKGKESQRPTSTIARLIDGVSFSDDDITESLELSLREDLLDDTVEATKEITWDPTVTEQSTSWGSPVHDSDMISFLQISKVSTTKGDISKREESQIVNGISFDTTSMSDESYSKDITSTFDIQHDNISIARLPSFYIPVNQLSSIEAVLRIENSHSPTRKVCLLVAILDTEGPNVVMIKKGKDAGKETAVLRLMVGDEEGKIANITVWRERAEEWGGMVRKGDVVYMKSILVSHAQKTPSITASRQLNSDCTICYRTNVAFASDRKFRPDLRLARSDPGIAKLAKVVNWLERMAMTDIN